MVHISIGKMMCFLSLVSVKVLNVEPSIDHKEYYNATIPAYFKQDVLFLEWVDQNFDKFEEEKQKEAIKMIKEAATINAVDATRVGKFDWSDVVKLHTTLNTPYIHFLTKYKSYFKLYENV